MNRPGKQLPPLTADQKSLVADNIGLAKSWVFRNRRLAAVLGVDEDDAMSAALMALTNAARCFKPELGFRFSTYAWRSIKAGVINTGTRREASFASRAGVRLTRIDRRDGDGRQIGAAGFIADHRERDVDSRTEATDAIAWLMPQLDDRSRSVVWMRFVDGLCLQEIGDKLGICKERVRQIQVKAIDQCRQLMAEADAA